MPVFEECLKEVKKHMKKYAKVHSARRSLYSLRRAQNLPILCPEGIEYAARYFFDNRKRGELDENVLGEVAYSMGYRNREHPHATPEEDVWLDSDGEREQIVAEMMGLA